MPWGRLDDTFYDHPKTVEAIRLGGYAAIGLHVMAWSYSSHVFKNNFVPRVPRGIPAFGCVLLAISQRCVKTTQAA